MYNRGGQLSPSDARFRLTVLGIGTLAEQVYLHLVESGAESAADTITEALGASPRVVQDALDLLEHQLLVTRTPVQPPRYSARPPEPALESLIARMGEELAQARLYARELHGRYRESGPHGGPEELLEIVVGEREVLRHYEHLLAGARSEVSVFTKPPYVVPDRPQDVGEVLRSERAGIQRGVRYRTVYDSAAVDEPFTLGLARDSMAVGEEARFAPELPMKLLLRDREIGFLPLRTEAPEAGSLIVRPSPLLDALVALFESVWARAVPLAPVHDPDAAGELDERSQRILVLMAGGLKDESIARALGTSRRTVQKHVSLIMDALGARTRFQAALRARERGWLDDWR